MVLDFMAIDCANCHLVQEYLEPQVDDLNDYNGDMSNCGLCWDAVFSRVIRMLNDTLEI